MGVNEVIKYLIPFLFISSFAWAEPPKGINPNSSISQWYRSLRSPDNYGCCSDADCRPVEFKFQDNEYSFLYYNKWYKIPKEKENMVILHNKNNPTGEAVACIVPTNYGVIFGIVIDDIQLLCFVVPPLV